MAKGRTAKTQMFLEGICDKDLRNLKYSQHQRFVFAFLTGKLKHWQMPFNLIFNSYPFGDYT